jgi:peptidoglycan hydrolase-like protein with peptidoglycan-binding domain
MEHISYDTVTQAVEGLKERGFTMDFNLRENCLICHDVTLNVEDFEIVEVHRFEGDSDPSDEAVVYAIQSKNGLNGILVNGYGISADALSAEMAQKLIIHKNK